MKWTWVSMPPAVTILPFAGDHLGGRADHHAGVTPSMMSGLPALPMPTMRPSRMPMSALTMPAWSRMSAFVITRSRAPSARVARDGLAHAVADHLAAAELRLVAGHGEVAFDLDEEVGVGEAHPVARGRPVEVGVLAARHPEAHRGVLPESTGLRASQGRRLRLLAGGAVREPVQAVDQTRAPDRHERHLLLVARLETHGGARRHVEAHAEGGRAVEAQRPVDLEEMEVRADLDRPVAGVRDHELHRPASDVADDVAFGQPILAGNHEGAFIGSDDGW